MSISVSSPLGTNSYSQDVYFKESVNSPAKTGVTDTFNSRNFDTIEWRKFDLTDSNCYQTTYADLGKIEFATTIVNQRMERATQVDDATRYQQADDMASDYTSFLYNNINKVNMDPETGNESPVRLNPYHEDIHENHITTYSEKTKKGTIINVSHVGSDRPDQLDTFGHAVQITRANGLQINLELTDDLRINELEDGGLAIYFASTGLTKHYSADGIESIIENDTALLGTDGDDIIINKYGNQINSGDGDDIIFNFANNAAINAGAGNDKIIIGNPEASGIQIDTGDGRDVVAAYSMNSSTINLNDDDFLIAARLDNSTITGAGNITIKAEALNNSTLSTSQGKADINIGKILDSAVSIAETDLVTFGSVHNSDVSLASSNIINAYITSTKGSHINIEALDTNLVASSILESDINIDSKKSNITSSSLIDSNLYTGDGADDIRIDKVHAANIYTNDGNDTIIIDSVTNSKVFSGNGNDTIKYRSALQSQINSGSGRDNVTSNIRIDKIYNKNLFSLAAKAWDDQVIFDA